MSADMADIPPRTIRHSTGTPLLDVTGMVGAYVKLKPTHAYAGKDANKVSILLTPDEVRELGYWLRVQADLVDAGRVPGTMR